MKKKDVCLMRGIPTAITAKVNKNQTKSMAAGMISPPLNKG